MKGVLLDDVQKLLGFGFQATGDDLLSVLLRMLGKNQCMKKTSIKEIIDDEVESLVVICNKRNIDPKNEKIPMGDNCQGYLPLKYLEQGYDVD